MSNSQNSQFIKVTSTLIPKCDLDMVTMLQMRSRHSTARTGRRTDRDRQTVQKCDLNAYAEKCIDTHTYEQKRQTEKFTENVYKETDTNYRLVMSFVL